MPPVSLTLRQNSAPTSTDGTPVYTVTNEVLNASGIDRSVFVFRADTSKFSHYASAPDMDALPTSQAVAISDGNPFYRLTSLTRSWPTISAMNEDLATTRTRLNALVLEVSKIQDQITIDQTIEIKAG